MFFTVLRPFIPIPNLYPGGGLVLPPPWRYKTQRIIMSSKRWCFTINNYSDEDIGLLSGLECKYLVYGKEVGESGTPHLQGFCTFSGMKRLSAMKKIHPTAHWETAKGTSEQAAAYCKKDGNFFEKGSVPNGVGGGNDKLKEMLNSLKKGASIKEVAEMDPATYVRNYRGIKDYAALQTTAFRSDDVRGYWFFGAPGTGKSHKARELFPEAYMKSQNRWCDGYGGESTIILDDLDQQGTCLGHLLKIWMDKYPCTGETKGGQVNLQHKRFIITSNYTPSELWPEDPHLQEAILRRVKFYEFSKVLVPPVSAGPGEWTYEITPELNMV